MSLFTSGIRLGRAVLRYATGIITGRKLDFSKASNSEYYLIVF